jgi:hypothetical protein
MLRLGRVVYYLRIGSRSCKPSSRRPRCWTGRWLGAIFCEQVIRENLDIGRPSQVQLIFDRRVSRRTPGRFRTREITEGVTAWLHVDYKRSRIMQYHKEEQAWS